MIREDDEVKEETKETVDLTPKYTIYERKFMLQSCHFNSSLTYDKYEQANCMVLEHDHGVKEVRRIFNEVMADIHGHNFIVTVTGNKQFVDGESCVVVWDEELEAMVRAWDRTNLSVHSDFVNCVGPYRRATTETMAYLLQKKLLKKWPDVFWNVSVQETPEIMAVAS